MRHFAGMSVAETAASLDTSQSTIERQWRAARAWLHREISEPE
jgi:DNA-directed RNA polymerase specialized sigma24 family protein